MCVRCACSARYLDLVQAKLGAEFLWGLVSRDWAGVVLDFLRCVFLVLELVVLNIFGHSGFISVKTTDSLHGRKQASEQASKHFHIYDTGTE